MQVLEYKEFRKSLVALRARGGGWQRAAAKAIVLLDDLKGDPEALAKQYVPESERLLAYTDVISPGEQQTVYIHAPTQPGQYPFLCSFPGHWMVMNGVLIVE